MNNTEAIELLNRVVEQAQDMVLSAHLASIMLSEGGEATWDSVKGVSSTAISLEALLSEVSDLREQFDDICP